MKRMKQALSALVITLILLSQTAGVVLALSLESIGNSSVAGRKISSWYYQGSNPTFSGTADPSATVTIDISGTSGTATADSAGSWSYKPTTLTTTGMYPITITSGANSLAFNLDITASSSSGSTSTKGGSTSGSLNLPDELPKTGSFEQTLLLMGTGLGLVLAGALFYWKVVPKLLFEDGAVSEDEE